MGVLGKANPKENKKPQSNQKEPKRDKKNPEVTNKPPKQPKKTSRRDKKNTKARNRWTAGRIEGNKAILQGEEGMKALLGRFDEPRVSREEDAGGFWVFFS